MKQGSARYALLAAAIGAICAGANAQVQEPAAEERLESANPAYERALEARGEVGELDDPRDVAVLDREDVEEAVEDIREESEELTEIAERREELRAMTEETIERLRRENESAGALLEQAHGYAVFDTTKGGLIVTGAGGSGVAVEPSTGETTFMHMGAAGIGVGGGVENYKLVLLFEDEASYDEFVEGRWDGSISAQAAAGDEGAAAQEQFVDGIKMYRLTDAGLIAQIDVSGMRFWRSDELNVAEDPV